MARRVAHTAVLPKRKRELKGSGSVFGGATTSTGTQVPNTLRSLTYVNVIDLLGEGPIGGFVFGLNSVFFNNVPYQLPGSNPVPPQNNTPQIPPFGVTDRTGLLTSFGGWPGSGGPAVPNGQFNFANTSVAVALGYPDQAALQGFGDVETVTSVGLQVFYGQPLIISITDLNADHVRVTLQVQALFSEDSKSGNVNSYSVNYSVDVHEVDGPWLTYPNSLYGKTMSSYAFDVQLSLPGVGPWEFRVVRLQPDDQDTLHVSVLALAAYTTIESRRFSYPNSAVVGVQTEVAVFSNSVPTRTYEIYGLLIQIPSNYDPLARTYNGLWDGTFVTGYSNNPVWVLYALLTNTRWGLGRFLGNYLPDKWGFLKVAQYCDQMIPDGFGGVEPRFTFNGSVPASYGSRDQAYKVLQDVASTFWGGVFWASGTIGIFADMPSDPVGPVFNQTNVVGGLFSYSGTALKARHLQALVSWWDPAQRYEAQVEVVQTFGQNAWNSISKQLIGCTSRGQAHRYGKWILDTEANATQTVTFTAGWDAVGIMPGNIIQVADPNWAGLRTAGRIAVVTTSGGPPTCSQVTLDTPYNFTSATGYQLSILLPNGVVETHNITNGVGSTAVVTVNVPFSQIPLVGSTYTITGDVAPQPFRVLVVKETQPNLYEITALQHDPTKYARIEQNIILQPTKYTVANADPPMAPTGLNTRESIFIQAGVTLNKVTFAWNPSSSPGIVAYHVQYLDLQGVWQDAGETSGSSIDIQGLPPGMYSFKVQAVNSGGQLSQFAELDGVGLQGLLAPPPDVASLDLTVTGQQGTLTWPPVNAANLGWYRIKWTPATTSTNWSSAQLIADNVLNTSLIAPTLGGTFFIKAVSTQGIESTDATSVSSIVAFANIDQVIAQLVEEPTFSGTKTNCSVTSGNLLLNFTSPTGYIPGGIYTFAETVDLGQVYTARMTALAQAFGQRSTDVMSNWITLASIVELSLVSSNAWNVLLQFRTSQQGWWEGYRIGGVLPYMFADFSTEGSNNPHYFFNGVAYNSLYTWGAAAAAGYTRGTLATFTGPNGQIQTTPLSARMDYDPVSLAVIGLLLEGASTNIATQSAQVGIGTGWAASNATVTANAAQAPDGTSTATQVAETAANTQHGVFVNVTVTPSVTYTGSIFLNANGVRYVELTVYETTLFRGAYAVFDLQTGVVTASGVFGGGTLVSTRITGPWTIAGKTFYRCSVAGTIGTGTSGVFSVSSSNTSAGAATAGGPAYVGNPANSFYAWGGQLERLNFASSYIPTTTAAVTRNADQLSLPWPSGTTATLLEQTQNILGPANGGIVGGVGNDTPIRYITDTSVSSYNSTSAITNTFTGSFLTPPPDTIVSGGSPSTRTITANGSTPTTDANAMFSANPTSFTIGYSGVGPTYGNHRQFGAWATAMTPAQMQALSVAPPNVFTYSDWAPLVVSYATFARVQFEAVLTSTDPQITPVVEELHVTIDMDKISQAANAVFAPLTGVTVNFTPPFKQLLSLVFELQNAHPGDWPQLVAKGPSGFTVIWNDINSNPVARTFDWHALGYGKVGG